MLHVNKYKIIMSLFSVSVDVSVSVFSVQGCPFHLARLLTMFSSEPSVPLNSGLFLPLSPLILHPGKEKEHMRT